MENDPSEMEGSFFCVGAGELFTACNTVSYLDSFVLVHLLKIALSPVKNEQGKAAGCCIF